MAVAAVVAEAVAVAVAAALGVLVVEFEALGDEFAALVVLTVFVPPNTFVALAVQHFGAH